MLNEVFITSTTLEITPVSNVDDKPIDNGTPEHLQKLYVNNSGGLYKTINTFEKPP
ncbi:hypothetical protein NXY55_24195 [Aeromonas veronii]|nr:hypothetical protein [Aeromonas veronii]